MFPESSRTSPEKDFEAEAKDRSQHRVSFYLAYVTEAITSKTRKSKKNGLTPKTNILNRSHQINSLRVKPGPL